MKGIIINFAIWMYSLFSPNDVIPFDVDTPPLSVSSTIMTNVAPTPHSNAPFTPLPTSQPTSQPRVVTEGEKFLIGLLPVLYSGDRGAIRKYLYTEGFDYDFINMIIDNMNYYQTAEKHSGYASAKVNRCESDTLDGKELYRFDTTVTFKDWTMREEVFKIVKDSSGFKLTD